MMLMSALSVTITLIYRIFSAKSAVKKPARVMFRRVGV